MCDGMKKIILILSITLVSLMFTLQISQTQATSLHIHTLTFQDGDGQFLQSDLFAEGADLSAYSVPIAPQREGYVFIGWSYDLTQGMPDASIVIFPEYIQTEYLVTNSI